MSSIDTVVKIDLDDVIVDMVLGGYMSHDDIVKFVIDLDEYVGDWDFTKQLYKHFKKEYKKLKAEK